MGLDPDWSRSTGVLIPPGAVVGIVIVVRSRYQVLARIRISMKIEVGAVAGLNTVAMGGVI